MCAEETNGNGMVSLSQPPRGAGAAAAANGCLGPLWLRRHGWSALGGDTTRPSRRFGLSLTCASLSALSGSFSICRYLSPIRILAVDGGSRPIARGGRGRLCALATDGGGRWLCGAATVRVVGSTDAGSRPIRNAYSAKPGRYHRPLQGLADWQASRGRAAGM
jgi:hypothetical protein